MANHGYPWLTMDIRGWPWSSIGLGTQIIVKTQYTGPFFPENGHGYPWLSMDIHNHGYPSVTMDIHGQPWISRVNHGYPWLTMDIHAKTKQYHNSTQNCPCPLIFRPKWQKIRGILFQTSKGQTSFIIITMGSPHKMLPVSLSRIFWKWVFDKCQTPLSHKPPR